MVHIRDQTSNLIMNIDVLWRAFVLTFALSTAYADLRWRKIPRGITVFAVVLGIVFNGFRGHLVDSLGTATLGFAISLGLFSLGAIGGGDVKLITALAAMLRFDSWTFAMEVAIFAAAAIALFQIARHGAVRKTFSNIGEIIRSFFSTGVKAHPVLNVRNEALIRSPFAVAAAVGTVFAVLKAQL